ncbi:MAG: hypothetical protein ACI9S9_001019 [Planctomycetota bacterium]|jgi:hypothetical protein
MSRLSLRVLLREASEDAKRECVLGWLAKPGTEAPTGKPVLSHVSTAMEDESIVLQRIGMLPRKLQDLLEVFFKDDGAVRVVQDLFTEFGRNFKSRFDLEASLAALHRESFLWPVNDQRWTHYDSPAWAAPSELVGCVREYRERRQRQLPDTLTLQGFLEARFFKKDKDNGSSNKERSRRRPITPARSTSSTSSRAR